MRMNQKVLNREEGALFWHEFEISFVPAEMLNSGRCQIAFYDFLIHFNASHPSTLVTGIFLPDLLSKSQEVKTFHVVQWGGWEPDDSLITELIQALGLTCPFIKVQSFSIAEDMIRGEAACLTKVLDYVFTQWGTDEVGCLSTPDTLIPNLPLEERIKQYSSLFSTLDLQIEWFSYSDKGHYQDEDYALYAKGVDPYSDYARYLGFVYYGDDIHGFSSKSFLTDAETFNAEKEKAIQLTDLKIAKLEQTIERIKRNARGFHLEDLMNQPTAEATHELNPEETPSDEVNQETNEELSISSYHPAMEEFAINISEDDLPF